jgi:hypothetical protein
VYALRNSGIREEDAERGREEGSECGKNKEIGGNRHKEWEERVMEVKGKVRRKGREEEGTR